MRKTFTTFILVALVGNLFAQTDSDRNFFLDTWQPKTFNIPNNFKIKQEGSATKTATLTVDVADSTEKVLPTQFGANITFRSGSELLTGDNRVSTFRKSGLNVYRYPAGSGSNTFFFDGNIPSSFEICLDKNEDTIAWSPIDGTKSKDLNPEEFVAFLDSVNGEATVVVNYFYARYGITSEGTREARVLQAAKYAAEFVRKMNVELNANIKYWEVGNECYGRWETGYNVDGLGVVTGTEYGEDFKVFAEEMRKVDPTIKIGAVLHTKDSDWNPQVIYQVQNDADFFIIHEYFTGSDIVPEDLLSTVGTIEEDVNLVRQTIEDTTDYSADYFPVALTEFNSRGNYTTNMVNAVFFTQILGEVMKMGIGLSTTWTGEWKYNTTDTTDQVKSLLAIGDPDQDNYTPYSVFMAYHFYDKMFGDKMLNITITDSNGINAYASRFSSGQIGLSVVNPSNEEIAIKLSAINMGDYKVDSVYWYEVAGSFDYRNTKFYINEETGSTVGGGPLNYNEILPYSKPFNIGETIVLPPLSTNFIVLTGQGSETPTGIWKSSDETDVFVYPNPASDVINILSSGASMEYRIFNIEGQLIKASYIDSKDVVVSVSDFPTGVYYLRVSSDKGSNVVKFIKK